MKIIKKLILLLILLLAGFVGVQAQEALVVEISGPITPATVELIDDALKENPDIIVLTIDTTGGDVDSTLKIIRLIEGSKTPFIGYVHPKGAKAWSAGTFILLSTHVAAMAPHTIIGSCQPVYMTQEGSQMVNDSKIINALTALMEERMRMHNRNISVVERFIEENLNLNDEEAHSMNVIEVRADDIDDLLDKIDGMSVTTTGENDEVIIDSRNSRVIYYEPSLKLKILTIISNPIIASILLMIGIYALIFGFSNPGTGSEILGPILIILGVVGMGFDINMAGVIMVIIGAALILFEFSAPGFGIIGTAGVVALIIGVIFMGPVASPKWYVSEEFMNTLIFSTIAPAVVFGAFLLFALFKVSQTRSRKPVIGESIIGDTALAKDDINPQSPGFVSYRGELWKAVSDQQISKGSDVKITDEHEYILRVEMVGEEYKE